MNSRLVQKKLLYELVRLYFLSLQNISHFFFLKGMFTVLEQLLVGRSAPTNKQMDTAMEIMTEFIFCESDRRGGRRAGGLNPLQELQLIDIICEYLSSCSSEITKNTIFLSLFGGMEGQRRLKILSILASMAVSASSTPVSIRIKI